MQVPSPPAHALCFMFKVQGTCIVLYCTVSSYRGHPGNISRSLWIIDSPPPPPPRSLEQRGALVPVTRGTFRALDPGTICAPVAPQTCQAPPEITQDHPEGTRLHGSPPALEPIWTHLQLSRTGPAILYPVPERYAKLHTLHLLVQRKNKPRVWRGPWMV